MLSIINLADPVKEVPSDLKRVFYENWEWFGHMTKTPSETYRSFCSTP